MSQSYIYFTVKRLTDDLIIKILETLRRLKDPQNFTAIRKNTGISPRILRKKLDKMEHDRLIKKQTKGIQEQIYTITPRIGLDFLLKESSKTIDAFCSKALPIITTFLEEVKKPENQETIKTLRRQRRSHSEKKEQQILDELQKEGYDVNSNIPIANWIAEHYGLDGNEVANKLEQYFDKIEQPVKELEVPLYEATKKMFELFLLFNHDIPYINTEIITEHRWIVMEPGMKIFDVCQNLEPPAFEFMLMKMRAEYKASIAYVNEMTGRTGQNARYAYDYDEEIREHKEELEEAFKKYLEKKYPEKTVSQ